MILVNQFWVFEKEEKKGIYQTLLKNCMNKHIKKIIIFIVRDTNVVLKHPKIQKVYVNKFLSTKKMVYDYLVYDDVYLISNNKIKFGKSILNFYKLNFKEENPININGTIIYKRINNIHTDGIKEIEYEREYEHKPNSNSNSNSNYRSKKTQPKKSESEKTYKIKTTTKLPDSNKKEEGEEKEEKEISKPINLQYKSKSKSKPNPKPKSKKRGSVPVKNINPKHPRNSNNKLAIVIHLYYQDLWFYFKERLEKIDYNYDLYVTLNESSTVGQTKWMKNKIEDFGGKVYILPNKGLDIGPFLYVMNLLFTKGKNYDYDYDYDYDYLIKLHSKKSIHNNIGDSWRNSLVNSLIGSDKILKDNIHKMNKDNKIGMLGSKEWILNDNKDYNNKYVNYYKDRLSIGKVPNKFIGGTMFMVDFNLLKKYFGKRAMNIYNELEEDYFQDHTEPKKTHSLERIFGSIVYDDNKVIG